MSASSVRQRARAAFVRGRLREGLGVMCVALLLVGVGATFSSKPLQALVFGALLLVGSGLFAFLGRDAGRAVVPALLAGSLPLGCALLGRHIGHVCTGTSCVALCVPLCCAGGLVAGMLLARFARVQAHPWRTWLFGVLVGACAGAMGCACVGFMGVAGMLLGLLAPRLVQVAWRGRVATARA